MDRLAVLVVGPDPLARAGLAAMLATREELRVVGEAGPEEAARAAASSGAAVALRDLGAGGGAQLQAEGLASSPIPSVALAATATDAADALRAGARSVLLRGAAADVVSSALVAAARGLAVLDPELADAWLRPPGPAAAGEGLTPREREVLALLAEGLGNKAIAARLGVSDHTAKFHVNAILAKLGAGSRAEAIVQAARMGLVAL
ncbi:MAG: response regulator transcription factor [Anaeromyxobacteraceae bacterium]